MIDKLQNKIDKYVISFDADFNSQEYIIEFEDMIIRMAMVCSVFVSKEEAIMFAIIRRKSILDLGKVED